LADEYGADKNTISRAVSEVLEPEGLVWAVPRRGTIVRHGVVRPHRPRGNLVVRGNTACGPGYCFPPESEQDAWRDHARPSAQYERMQDPRLAGLLKVPTESTVLVWHRVSGPDGEPPFQVSDSWIHPRVAGIAGVADQAAQTGDWTGLIEKAGHGPLSWTEYHRARLPTKGEAAELQIAARMPVMEIVRVAQSALDGEPAEVTASVIPGDRVEVVVQLRRADSVTWPKP
jgi:DNA-binding GntR family transcriptional regulator